MLSDHYGHKWKHSDVNGSRMFLSHQLCSSHVMASSYFVFCYGVLLADVVVGFAQVM